jgi:creatinine amidohydrolase
MRYWQSLTTKEVREAVEHDPVVILPLAAIEQHGPHLPLSTDLDIGMGLLASAFDQIGSDFPAWVLPPVAVGASGEHLRLAGTLSLEPDTLSRVIYEYGAALAASGVRRFVLSNSHGGNRQTLDAAALRLRRAHRVLVVKVNYFEFPPPETAGLTDAEWRHGLHGGAIETAMMLHLRPETVRASEILDAPPLGEELERTMRRLAPEGAASFSWLAEDIHPSGIAGNAREADAAKGQQLVDYYGGVLADVIRDTRAFPIDRLV